MNTAQNQENVTKKLGRNHEKATSDLKQSKEILEESSDEELRELASMEIGPLESRLEELKQEMMILLLPKDPNDDKNIIPLAAVPFEQVLDYDRTCFPAKRLKFLKKWVTTA